MTTYCEDCDNVVDRKKHLKYWTCSKFLNLNGKGFMSKTKWVGDAHMKTSGINGGICPMWTPRREIENDNNVE